jgi:hypothetical protein
VSGLRDEGRSGAGAPGIVPYHEGRLRTRPGVHLVFVVPRRSSDGAARSEGADREEGEDGGAAVHVSSNVVRRRRFRAARPATR